MINETLAHLGLSKKEIEIYLAIVECGQIGSSALSRRTGVNRTTVYSVTKELIKKGLVAEDLGAASRKFTALPPTSIESMIAREQEILESKKRWAMKAVREVDAITRDTGFTVPKVVYIEDADVRAYLSKQTSAWNNSIAKYDGIYWGFQDRHLVQHYEDWIDEYWIAHESSKPIKELRLISDAVAEKHKKVKYPHRKIKFWDKATAFSATTWVMGDYVVMIVANKRPHYLVEIYDAMLAQNMRAVFKGLWEEIEEDERTIVSKPQENI